jgi:hypothetical protein
LKKTKTTRHKIRKRSQNHETFDVKKFKRSLLRSGLNEGMCNELISRIDPKKSCYKSTSSLFRATRSAIYTKNKKLAAHYSLKKSIFDLGPTGYPFEHLCAELFSVKGFKTQVSVTKKGKFVSHEIDVVASRTDLTIFCECKFHRSNNHKNDIKLPLYVHSRYLDLEQAGKYGKIQYAIMTNTNFSKDAIKYSEGVGLILFSPDYPDKDTFYDLMKKYNVYPVTILKNLKKREAKQLIDNGVIVVKQLKDNHLEEIGFPKERIEEVLLERKALLN